MGWSCLLSLLCPLTANSQVVFEPQSVGGLRIRADSSNVVLTWPSAQRESFVVLWRSNATVEATWVVLTNQAGASRTTNETIYCDVGALDRSISTRTNSSLDGFYRVFAIPDFSFDLEGAALRGGPKNPGQDFLPVSYDTNWTHFLITQFFLLVDGTDEGFGKWDMQRVNFGTMTNPHWAVAPGFWLRHDHFPNGMHTLQIQTILPMNNLVGEMSQDLVLSNQPVRVQVSNAVSFVGWEPFITKTDCTIVAQSVLPRVRWHIDIYDSNRRLLAGKSGQTTNGEIRWSWDLRDNHGRVHNDPDADFVFFPAMEVWPLDKPSKGGRNDDSWWSKRLGRKFVKLAPAYPTKPPLLESNSVKSDLPPPSAEPPLLPATNAAISSMILDLGATSRFIRVTADYSNAVLAAVLPIFSDAAKKLDLPVPQPITQTDIAGFHVLPFREPTASLLLKNGWVFNFGFGYVQDFSSPNSYLNLQDPEKIPNYYGEVKMSRADAIHLAREILLRLNIPLEDVFAEQEPRVTSPEKIETNTVARYRIEWLDPRSGKPAVDIELSSETKQVERVLLRAKSLERPAPFIGVVPPPGRGRFDSNIPGGGRVNPEYASRLIPIMFKAIDEYGQKLSLPIPQPLNTSNVARVEIRDNGGWPHCEITLTNGWRFIYRNSMVNGHYAPDNFFSSDRPIHVRDFTGDWNLSQDKAVEIVKSAMAKLNYPTNLVHMDFAPNVITASGDFKEHIPRLLFEWHYAPKNDLQSKIEAEVDANNGRLKSLYYDDVSYWGHSPIDVPISIR